MKLSTATRMKTGFSAPTLLCLLMITFARPMSGNAQTRNQLQQNNAPGYNYQSGAYRKLFYVPEDTLATADSGAIAFKGGVLWLKNSTHWVPSTGVNFAIADLVLNGNRNHNFGTYSMKFNFTGLGVNGDGYVGFNESGTPGITIQGDGSFIGPTIAFKDLAAPSSTGTITFNGGDIRLDAFHSTVKGIGRIGPDSSVLGVEYAGLSKRIALWNATSGKYGISIRDTLDKAGMYYENNYRDSGLAKFGERWIPDVGYINNRIPNDYNYITVPEDCHDTSFVNSAGTQMWSYKKKMLPQFIGLRVRVVAGGLVLSEAEYWGWSWYYTWNKVTGELRVFGTIPCGSGGASDDQMLIQGY
jgi:hypothetical protein